MSLLINALNKSTPLSVGEKGHLEYTWSNDIDEKIVQLFFQLVRTKNTKTLEQQLHNILNTLKNKYDSFEYMNASEATEVVKRLTTLYKMIGQTRDIINGKGELDISFMQICVWYEYFPSLALNAFTYFVDIENEHPYGSWKDVKYLCNYAKEYYKDKNHPLIKHACSLLVSKLKLDWENYSSVNGESKSDLNNVKISLATKWAPREPNYRKKKYVKFGWLFKPLAMETFPHFLKYTSKDKPSWEKAILKCKTHFKKRITLMNKFIDTTQIKQTSHNWQHIDFNHVTTQTMRKQRLAFQNKTKKGDEKKDLKDRKICAENFKNLVNSAKLNPAKYKVHGRRCNVYELVNDALKYYDYDSNSTTIDTINLQWDDNAKNNMGLSHLPIISMVDTSGSMECDDCIPLYNAIGLGIRTSELTHPAFRNNIMTFDSTPKWVNMSDCNNFWEKVHKVKRAAWGTSTNIYLAFKMVLDTCVKESVPPSEVENMIIAIYSDMQIDSFGIENSPYNNKVMSDKIDNMYMDAGYNRPHLLFWNLRSTDGFPMISKQSNITALSGYNSTLLNVFCNKGIEGLKEYTPAKALENLLNNDRYNKIEQDVVMFINNY